MIGTRLAHYRIDARLGEGGMGEVFLAQDLALGRTAAIKVLPAEFRPDLRVRLLREAEASRRLQHPGIATFFEAGEDGPTAYIAMEYVLGMTLRDRLRRGALTVPETLAIATGLLEALGHAHVAGIIHRDIKPENVMITLENTAKLLDFGLALHDAGEGPTRAHVGALDSVVSTPGMVMGSIGYMAPEQLQGTGVDTRTDLFAVGAVLYEMLAGEAAFPGSTVAARMAATLFGEPAPLRDGAAPLWGVVARALAKDPEARYASASEFLRDVRKLGEGQAVATYPDTLAILDFNNRTGQPADAWIGSGIAESMGADLARFGDIRIVPRARVGAVLAAAPDAEPSTIGARLGCRWVLSGGYQRMADALRVVMELTHVPTDRVTLVEKLDGRVDEIFAMQDRLGQKAAAALALDERTASADAQAPAPALGAYECYTRGQQHFIRMGKGEFDVAQDLFEEAVRQEPDYADPLTGLAAVHDMRFTFLTDRTELEHAIRYASRAVAISPGHAMAHVWLAYALWRRGSLDDALATIRRAATLDSANFYAPYFEACMLLNRGEPEPALSLYQHTVQTAPGFGFGWVGLGNTHLALGHFTEADWSLRRAIELESRGFHSTAGAAGYLGECMRRQGRLAEARTACLEGLEAVERTDHMYRDTFRAICLNVLGRTALDGKDAGTADAAFRQCELHLGGRSRSLGGGQLLCQAMAGRAVAQGDAAALRAAAAFFAARTTGDWSWFWRCDDGTTKEYLERLPA